MYNFWLKSHIASWFFILFLYLKVCLKIRNVLYNFSVSLFRISFKKLRNVHCVEWLWYCVVLCGTICGTMWFYQWYYVVLCVVLCDCLICIKPVSIGLLTCNYMLANKTTHTWHVRLSSFSLDGSTWDNYICQSIIYMYLLFGWSLLFQWFDWMFR